MLLSAMDELTLPLDPVYRLWVVLWDVFGLPAHITCPLYASILPVHSACPFCLTILPDHSACPFCLTSRRRAFNEDEESYSINDRNRVFNKKISRAFDKYTMEIKQNIERGTAL